MVVAVVTAVTPAHPATFEEAQPQIRKALLSERTEVLLSQKASDLVAKTKALNGDLKKAAASMGLEMKTSPDVDRSASIEGIGGATTIPDLFTKPAGEIIGPITLDGQRVVAKVISKTEPDPAGMAAQMAVIRNDLRSKRARERNQVFEDGVRQMLTKEGKIKVNQDAIDRIVAGYRG
jgi:hypothetical protein